MSEYTPTTSEIRTDVTVAFRYYGRLGVEGAEAFDRWLERVRNEERERCAQIAAGFRLNADVETVVGLSWNRDMDKLIAAIRERQAPEMAGWDINISAVSEQEEN